MALDNSNGEGSSASAASVVQLVSFARGDGKSVADCHSMLNGCKAVFYFDYSHPYQPQATSCHNQPDAQVVAAASEDWFLHWTGFSDASHRVYGEGPPGDLDCTIWVLNPNSSGAQAWWLNYLRNTAGSYDEYLIDDNSPTLANATFFSSGGGCSPWPTICAATQEIPNDLAEAHARANFVNAMTHSDGSPMFFFSNGSIVPELSFTNRYLGQLCEGCFVNDLRGVVPGNYATQLDQMAILNASSAAQVLVAKGHSADGSSEQMLQRTVAIGLTWLGYSEGHTILMENLEDATNHLAVWPEELLYPASPVQTMTSGAINLSVGSGVWRREFRACYQRGVFFGSCAAIVNANDTPVAVQTTWLSQHYSHVITFSGGDVLSGGATAVNAASFTAGVTQLPANGALLLAR